VKGTEQRKRWKMEGKKETKYRYIFLKPKKKRDKTTKKEETNKKKEEEPNKEENKTMK
jgi:hypothetical protein